MKSLNIVGQLLIFANIILIFQPQWLLLSLPITYLCFRNDTVYLNLVEGETPHLDRETFEKIISSFSDSPSRLMNISMAWESRHFSIKKKWLLPIDRLRYLLSLDLIAIYLRNGGSRTDLRNEQGAYLLAFIDMLFKDYNKDGINGELSIIRTRLLYAKYEKNVLAMIRSFELDLERNQIYRVEEKGFFMQVAESAMSDTDSIKDFYTIAALAIRPQSQLIDFFERLREERLKRYGKMRSNYSDEDVHVEDDLNNSEKTYNTSYSKFKRYQRYNNHNQRFSFIEYVKRPSHQVDSHLLKNIGRILIPFELFDVINKNFGFRHFTQKDNVIDKLNISESARSVIKKKRGKIEYKENIYYFEICDIKILEWNKRKRWNFMIHFRPEEIKNEWHNLVTAFTDIVVVTEKNFYFVTAYPLGHNTEEYYLKKILQLFVERKFDELKPYASEHLCELLSTFLICNICSESGNFSDFLTIAHDKKGKEKLVVAANESTLIFYAFDKQSANLLAREMDNVYDNVLVVYFVNLNFEEQIKNRDIKREHTMTISIKEFMDSMNVTPEKKRKYELGISYLLHIMNNEDYSWMQKESQIKDEILLSNEDNVYDISESLLQDALNILVENHPQDKLDVFHFLCASNLINAYMSSYNKKYKYIYKSEVDEYNERRMWSFKKHIFNTFEEWKREDNDCVHFSFTKTEEEKMMLLANITIEGEYYQFKFMAMGNDFIDHMHEMGINDKGIAMKRKLQPIAPLLLEYSLCLRARYV